ncbi:MAG: ATP synthase F1 subunit epsilon [Oscillospiraceae bacterium]|nr:ATP synthase F1 subunit epsilon [Oscillospiraceae bacterium]
MNPFPLQIVTPDGIYFDGEAQQVIVRTTEGEVGILRGHADYVAALSIGEARITVDGQVRRAACNSGMISVNKGLVRVVAVTFEWSDDIDLERAQRAKEKAEKALQEKTGEVELRTAELKLKRALTRIKVAK